MISRRLLATAAAVALATTQVAPAYALPYPDVATAPAGSSTTKAANASFVATAIAKLKTDLLILLQQSYTLQEPSAAALRALAGFPGVTVHRSGFAAPGDGGAADYAFNATACTTDDGGSCLNSLGGGSWRIDWSSVNFEANAATFGAQFNGSATTAQDTVAVQAALASGQQRVRLPTLGGSFWPNACMAISVNSQHIYSDTDYLGGLSLTILSSLAQSNAPNCKGIFNEATNGLSPFIENLTAGFAQPDQSDPAQMIQYPPLYFLQNGGRFRLVNDICTNATVCVDMKGNSGGAYIQDLQFNAYKFGIDIDGSLDTVRINNPHWFPYNMTGNQQTAFFSQGSSRPIGIHAGRMDDMKLTGGLFIGGLALQGYAGTGATYNGQAGNAGTMFAMVTGTDFDTFSGVQLLGGSVNCASCTFSLGVAAAQGIDVQGINNPYLVSQFTCAGCSVYNQSATVPMVTQEVGSGSNAISSSVNFSGSILVESLADDTFFLNTSGSLVLSGNTFIRRSAKRLTRQQSTSRADAPW